MTEEPNQISFETELDIDEEPLNRAFELIDEIKRSIEPLMELADEDKVFDSHIDTKEGTMRTNVRLDPVQKEWLDENRALINFRSRELFIRSCVAFAMQNSYEYGKFISAHRASHDVNSLSSENANSNGESPETQTESSDSSEEDTGESIEESLTDSNPESKPANSDSSEFEQPEEAENSENETDLDNDPWG